MDISTNKLRLNLCYLFMKILSYAGLYPNINLYQLYYENPNSFMPCKVFEFKELIKNIKVSTKDTVLDLGCAEGSLTLILGKMCKKIIGVEPSFKAITSARHKSIMIRRSKIYAEFRCAKIEDTEFDNGYFDKIFSFSVIEHIPNYIKVLEETYRILKKDGQLVISVDSLEGLDDNLRKIHRNKFNVQKYFMREELESILKKIGFRYIRIYPIFKSEFAKNWFTRVIRNPDERFGRLKSYRIYAILKQREKECAESKRGMFLVAKCLK